MATEDTQVSRDDIPFGRAPYIYAVQMDIAAEHEAEFNRVYDTEHVPMILNVPGVRSCYRYVMERSNKDGAPRYLALYEVDSPDVPQSPAWVAASDTGNWAPRIRPHTTNRAHHLMRRIG
jgi:hypothetical protein